MEKTCVRSFSIDGDICCVKFIYDEDVKKYLGDYPDFETTPRTTPGGYSWVNATQDSCHRGIHIQDASKTCLDCGSCRFFTTEKQGDLIGICKPASEV